MKKKLTPASIISQKPRKEAFLSRDIDYLSRNPSVALGKKIADNGHFGDVYAVKGNKNLVVKIQKYFDNPPDVQQWIKDSKRTTIEREMENYQKYDLNNEPIFIPTHVANVRYGNNRYKGMVRPRVIAVVDHPRAAKKRITDTMLIIFRQKLIALSHKGFVFGDGLQVGVDDTGRLLIFDVGHLEKENFDKHYVFSSNNIAWVEFLASIGKFGSFEKYGGALNPKEQYS